MGPSLALAGLLLVPQAAASPAASDACGVCHRDIYRMWKGSAHAASMEGAGFLEVYRAAEAATGRALARVCLRCHAPLAEVTGDVDLKRKSSWEGVSCEVCHSLTAVHLSGPGPYLQLDLGGPKRGPIRGASSPAHEVAYSELHTTALACAGCHEYTNGDGTPILTTYSEWQLSSAARAGKACQSCHMAEVRGDVVDPRLQREHGAAVNLHEVPGTHSLQQLNRALKLLVTPVRQGHELLLEVTLWNRGAGHAVPTGMPGRRVILTVRVETYPARPQEQQRVYTRTFQRPGGALVDQDSGYFVDGVRELSDSRLRPDERRVETFRFATDPSASVHYDVKLLYEHVPMPGSERPLRTTFLTESRTLPPAGS
ncbi:MAG TPA: multiheme c-type cytochrome [Candidatus Polarisedimenticolaceae bacterium]|nr:multiheme c-type cytochrome [Candidatus Polarisedimenticolaceae bacterium]